MIKKVLVLSLIGLGFTMCSKVPLTGRRQLNLIPSSEINALSADSYKSFLNENKVITGTTQSQQVTTVED